MRAVELLKAAKRRIHQPPPGRADIGFLGRQGGFQNVQGQRGVLPAKGASDFCRIVGAVVRQQQYFIAVGVQRSARAVNLICQRVKRPCQPMRLVADGDDDANMQSGVG